MCRILYFDGTVKSTRNDKYLRLQADHVRTIALTPTIVDSAMCLVEVTLYNGTVVLDYDHTWLTCKDYYTFKNFRRAEWIRIRPSVTTNQAAHIYNTTTNEPKAIEV